MTEHGLCTIELIADGHAERCPGQDCAFWHDGCVLEAVEVELQATPEVAELLLSLRREIEQGARIPVDEARERLLVAMGEASDETGPAGGATELV
jgi:hypothetical protein